MIWYGTIIQWSPKSYEVALEYLFLDIPRFYFLPAIPLKCEMSENSRENIKIPIRLLKDFHPIV